MSKITTLAMRVAKIFIIFSFLFSLTIVVDAQKHRKSKAKEIRIAKVAPKTIKKKKSVEPEPVKKDVNALTIHTKDHRGQDWWTWWEYDNIKLTHLLPDPVFTLEYFSLNRKIVSEKPSILKWNGKTSFSFQGETFEGKCYFVLYCKVHHLALSFEEQPCPQEKPK